MDFSLHDGLPAPVHLDDDYQLDKWHGVLAGKLTGITVMYEHSLDTFIASSVLNSCHILASTFQYFSSFSYGPYSHIQNSVTIPKYALD